MAEFGAAYRYNNTCETDGNTENPCEESSPEHAWAENLCHAIIRNPGKWPKLRPKFYCGVANVSHTLTLMDLSPHFVLCFERLKKHQIIYRVNPMCIFPFHFFV